MIDTIGIRILQKQKEVEKHIKKQITVRNKRDGTKRVIKSIDLIKFDEVKDKNITLIRVSLTKFKRGNNFQNVSWKGILNAIDLLLKLIRIDEDKLLLYRVDISYNFTLDKSNNYYLSQFNLLDGYKMDTFNNYRGCQYRRNEKTILFYSKLDIVPKYKVPNKYRTKRKNYLRYEMQYKNKLSKQFGINQTNIATLKNKEFLKLLLKGWYKHYKLVAKTRLEINGSLPELKHINKVVTFRNWLAYNGLNEIGNKQIQSLVENDLGKGKKKSDLKKCLNNIINVKSIITKKGINYLDYLVEDIFHKKMIEIDSL